MEELVDTQDIEATDVSGAWEDETPYFEADSQPEEQTEAAVQPEEERFTLKYMGQEHSVSRDEVTSLAQKGMDYDRIRGRLEAASNGDASEEEPALGDRARQAENARSQGFLEFFRSRPDVTAEDIPASVFKAVRAGESLTAAYSMYENKVLKSELSALKKGEENRRKAASAATSVGRGDHQSALDEAWYDGR